MTPTDAELTPDDWRRICDALRYLGRDLHHRSFSVTAMAICNRCSAKRSASGSCITQAASRTGAGGSTVGCPSFSRTTAQNVS